MAKRKRAARQPVSRKPSTAGKKGEETTRKPVPKKSSAVDQNEEAFLNFVNQNNKEKCRNEDSNDYEVNNLSDSCSGSDFPSEADSSSPSSSSSSESDEPYNAADGSSDDLSINKRPRKPVKRHGKATEKARKLSKKEEKENLKLSRVLRSSNRKPKELETPHQDLQYKKELKAALGVIKKVMKMDEAQPFNVAVDPVALGKPDFFDIIDTPMDFSMICSNLQNNVKYKNSEDVYKDVKYIWENCFKYNKKGEYIVYLVKRVKKKFMKYWIAGGLYNEQSRKPNENLHLQPPADHTIKHDRYEPMHQVGNAIDGISHRRQNGVDPSQPYWQLPPLSYSQPYQSRQPPPSTMWPQLSQFPPSSSGQPHQLQHLQPSTNQPQYSQLQPCADCSSAGDSHFQPHEKVQKQKNYPPSSSLGPTGPLNQSQPLQPQLIHKQPLVMQQPQQSASHMQASQLPAALDTRHSHMPPHMDYTRYPVPCGPADLEVMSPMQVHPLSNVRLDEPQQLRASDGQPQSSWFQTNADIEHSITDSATRGIRCALKYSAGPIVDSSNQGQKDQLSSGVKLPEQSPMNQNQGDQLQQPTKTMKKGRGPTRCLFLNELEDGERIVVSINKLGQPIGPESSKLSSFLGTVARNGYMAPLTYLQWRHMPDSYKEKMWQHVQTKFDMDPSCKSWVMKSLANKWRDWKAELKAKHYYPHKTDEERLMDCHPRVVPDQWTFLVSYWNSDNAKKQCTTNKANRLKQKAKLASGSKSFARIREEERMKRPDGKEPTRAELYILTHTRRKDGQPVDEIAAANIAKLRELATKKQNGSECSDDDNDTLCQVLGEEEDHRYVRTYGLGPTPDDVYGPSATGPRATRDLINIASDVKKSASEEVRKVLEKMEAMEQKYANMENHIASLTSNMQKFLEKFGGPSNILGSEQVLNTPNSLQLLHQPHLHSTSSSHAGANGRGYA
ncbi:hypothetical protein SLEP1_g34048 [Rubroshorea leprosula]|uniref:Bromo domain-containing protein n=2 Tax=Rubroshorea leprosula TaxID=152421 RepID=A0AAV5KIU6_9ROSI|nr:hypothetical protein SLEP1_g34048 [Rubroshorea leprosula]